MIDMLGSSTQKYNTGLPFSFRSSGHAVLYFSMLLVRIHTRVQEGFVFCQALIRRMHGDARRSHGAEVVRIESGLPVGFLQVVGGKSYRGEKTARATNNFSDYFVLPVDQIRSKTYCTSYMRGHFILNKCNEICLALNAVAKSFSQF